MPGRHWGPDSCGVWWHWGCSPGRDIWGGVGGSGETREERKILISTLRVF